MAELLLSSRYRTLAACGIDHLPSILNCHTHRRAAWSYPIQGVRKRYRVAGDFSVDGTEWMYAKCSGYWTLHELWSREMRIKSVSVSCFL